MTVPPDPRRPEKRDGTRPKPEKPNPIDANTRSSGFPWWWKVWGLRLRKGDYLAVRIPETFGPDEAKRLADSVREQWPDINTLIFAGDVEMFRVRKDEA